MKNVLKNIQKFDPPEEIWDKIAVRLSEKTLKNALGHTKQYSPSDDVWETLEKKLKAKTQAKSWTKWASVAACILFFLSFGIWFLKPQESYLISTKPFQPQLSTIEVSKTDEAYQEIQIICQKQKYACERADYKTLNEEYLTLKNAETELRNAIGQFNSELSLIEELNRIEKQKTLLINEMAEKI